jgi:integrase
MAALREQDGPVVARALEMVILTGCRVGEIAGATWDEIDVATKTWTVPAARMKKGREHRVPLSDRAIAILKAQAEVRESEYVFPSGHDSTRPLHSTRVLVFAKAINPNITVHGFRSTFMDWSHERTAFAKVVIDQALAHAISDAVEAAYRRGDLFDKRRQLMAEWAKYCQTKPISKGKSNVTPIRGATS